MTLTTIVTIGAFFDVGRLRRRKPVHSRHNLSAIHFLLFDRLVARKPVHGVN
jgi:hypothetical protein